MTKVGTIRDIWRFPMKSAFGEQVDAAVIARDGMPSDRVWALRDEELGELTNGKKIPKILSLRARYLEPPEERFDSNQQAQIEITFPDGRTVRSDDPLASAMVSMFLGRRVSLQYRRPAGDKEFYKIVNPPTPNEVRHYLGITPDEPNADLSHFPLKVVDVMSKYMTPPGAFYDIYPLHFMTTSTLAYLQQHHRDGDIRADRFRPSFVIQTDPSVVGLVENDWQGAQLRIGNTVIDCGHPTIRCSIPGAAQPGMEADPQIPRVVQSAAGRNLGIYGQSRAGGTIRVGDTVELLPRKTGVIYDMARGAKRGMTHMLLTQMRKSMERKAEKSPAVLPAYPRGFVPHRLVQRVEEATGITSFHFARVDGVPMPVFIPGQHAIIGFENAADGKKVFRPYTLSSAGQGGQTLRISVKRDSSEVDGQVRDGVASCHLHDRVQVGDEVQIKTPAGSFGSVPTDDAPMVMLCTGIGITPFISMLTTLAQVNPTRRVDLFYGAMTTAHMAFVDELTACAAKMPNLTLNLFISDEPVSEGGPFTHGLMQLDTILNRVGDTTQVYLCGNPGFTQSMRAGLEQYGVEADRVFFESFAQARQLGSGATDGKSHAVSFQHSGNAATWVPGQASLLELAEEMGLNPASGCRYGACQACECTMHQGEVTYPDGIDPPTAKGKILLCAAQPQSDLVLDL